MTDGKEFRYSEPCVDECMLYSDFNDKLIINNSKEVFEVSNQGIKTFKINYDLINRD